MSPHDYLIEFGDECWICIGENTYDEYWVLGDSFLRGFYSVHDYKSMMFGLAPHATSKKAAPKVASELLSLYDQESNSIENLFRLLALAVTFVLVAIFGS